MPRVHGDTGIVTRVTPCDVLEMGVYLLLSSMALDALVEEPLYKVVSSLHEVGGEHGDTVLTIQVVHICAQIDETLRQLVVIRLKDPHQRSLTFLIFLIQREPKVNKLLKSAKPWLVSEPTVLDCHHGGVGS